MPSSKGKKSQGRASKEKAEVILTSSDNSMLTTDASPVDNPSKPSKKTRKKITTKKSIKKQSVSKDVDSESLGNTAVTEEVESVPEQVINEVELVTFKFSGKGYALRIESVEEILRKKVITLVPRTKLFVAGITSVRGKVIPVIDIWRLLNVPEGTTFSDKAKILVVGGSKGSVGFRVEHEIGLMTLPEDSLVAPPSHISTQEAMYIEKVVMDGDEFISVLNVDEILNVNSGWEA